MRPYSSLRRARTRRPSVLRVYPYIIVHMQFQLFIFNRCRTRGRRLWWLKGRSLHIQITFHSVASALIVVPAPTPASAFDSTTRGLDRRAFYTFDRRRARARRPNVRREDGAAVGRSWRRWSRKMAAPSARDLMKRKEQMCSHQRELSSRGASRRLRHRSPRGTWRPP